MPIKRGHKTTEFLLTVLVAGGTLASALAGALPPRWAALAATVSTVAYTLSRGVAKAGAGGGS